MTVEGQPLSLQGCSQTDEYLAVIASYHTKPFTFKDTGCDMPSRLWFPSPAARLSPFS